MYNLLSRLTSILILISFLYSFVLQQPLHAATELIGETRRVSALKNIAPRPQVPVELGRITDKKLAGSNSLVIYIQDLHCNPGVQKNILNLLSFINSRKPIHKIFVEGAPRGKVDLRHLSSIPGEATRWKALDTLLNKGILTGAEYFCVKNRQEELYGLEDWNVYLDNVARMKSLLALKEENKKEIAKAGDIVDAFSKKHLPTKVRKILIALNREESTKKHCRRLEKLGRAAGETTANYPDLHRYISLIKGIIDINSEIDPVCLLNEEKLFKDKVIAKYIESVLDRDIIFMTDMAGSLRDYAALSMTPEQYRYFSGNRERFKVLMRQYFGHDQVESIVKIIDNEEIDRYFQTNKARNGIFVGSIVGQLDANVNTLNVADKGSILERLDSFNEINVVIAGGFHHGLGEDLGKNNLSFLTIMPNVRNVADRELYEKLICGRADIETVFNSALGVPLTALNIDVNRMSLLVSAVFIAAGECGSDDGKALEELNGWLRDECDPHLIVQRSLRDGGTLISIYYAHDDGARELFAGIYHQGSKFRVTKGSYLLSVEQGKDPGKEWQRREMAIETGSENLPIAMPDKGMIAVPFGKVGGNTRPVLVAVRDGENRLVRFGIDPDSSMESALRERGASPEMDFVILTKYDAATLQNAVRMALCGSFIVAPRELKKELEKKIYGLSAGMHANIRNYVYFADDFADRYFDSDGKRFVLPGGVAVEFYRKPREEHFRVLLQNDPDAGGNTLDYDSKQTFQYSRGGEIFRIGPTETHAEASVEYLPLHKEVPTEKWLYTREICASELFRTLPEKVQKLIASIVTEISVDGGEKGSDVIKEGEKGDTLYLIVDGEVDVVKTVNGQEKHLATRSAGQFVGEMALFEKDYVRNATCRVAPGEKARFLAIKRIDFERIAARYPLVKFIVERTIKGRIHSTLKQNAVPDNLKYIFTDLNGLKVFMPCGFAVNEEYIAYVPGMGNDSGWFHYDPWGIGKTPKLVGFDEAIRAFLESKMTKVSQPENLRILRQRLEKLRGLSSIIEEQLNGRKVLSVCLFGSILDAFKEPHDVDVMVVTDDSTGREERLYPPVRLDIPGIPRKLDCVTIGKEYLLTFQEGVNSVLFAWYLGRMVWGEDIFNGVKEPTPNNALMWGKIFLDKTFLMYMSRYPDMTREKIMTRLSRIVETVNKNVPVPGYLAHTFDEKYNGYREKGDIEKCFYSVYRYLDTLRTGKRTDILPAFKQMLEEQTNIDQVQAILYAS